MISLYDLIKARFVEVSVCHVDVKNSLHNQCRVVESYCQSSKHVELNVMKKRETVIRDVLNSHL